MYKPSDLLTIGDAANLLGIAIETLRRWEKAGKIDCHRTKGGHRRYLVADLLGMEKDERQRYTVVYGRVSTRARKSNLDTQMKVLEAYCADRGFDNVYALSDIGSGMNFKKRGLLKLIDLLQRDEVERLVITDKDRLLRFGSELIFALCEANHAEILIINRPTEQEPEQELVEDLMAIVTVFSARLYGKRSRRNLKAMQVLHEAGNAIVDSIESQDCRD